MAKSGVQLHYIGELWGIMVNLQKIKKTKI